MGSMNLDNVKAVVPIHGGLTPLRAVQTDSVTPYVMILSGGVDDAHGNTTELELHLDAANATWEISRYSNAQHGFTGWSSPAYQPMADSRSWMSTMGLFETMVADATTTGDSDSSSDEAMELGSAEMMDTGDAKEDLSHDEDDEDHSHDESDMGGEDHSSSHDEEKDGEHQSSHDEEKEDGEVHDHSTHDHMSDYKNAMGDESEMSDESELSSADRRSSFGVVVVSMAAALFAALVAV